MNKPRRFKTRNGSILEECPNESTVILENGYMDDYIIINSTDKNFKNGENICLLLESGELPKGGEHDDDWDIIEEVSDDQVSSDK